MYEFVFSLLCVIKTCISSPVQCSILLSFDFFLTLFEAESDLLAVSFEVIGILR